MYNTLLALHSLTRWLVLAGMIVTLFLAYRGWLLKKPFSKIDDIARIASAAVAHVQLVLGIILYFISPIVSYFLHNFSTAVHDRAIRFFGMEHVTMMLIAITLVTIGSAKAKRKTTDREKFKTLAIWYTIALLLIFSSIPWSFSPLISRPNFRPL
jgi:heme A synthase